MLAKSATNVLASSFYKNSIYLLFNSELDPSAIDSSQFSVSVNGGDRNIQTVSLDPALYEWSKVKYGSWPDIQGVWYNSLKITLNSELSTSDDVSVTYKPNENGSQNLSFIESSLGSGADLQFDALGLWQTSVIQNPKYGAGAYALVNVENGNILNCIVDTGLYGPPSITPEITGYLENGFHTGSGIYTGYSFKYYTSPDYAVAEALLIPAKFLNTPQASAVTSKYWMGGAVDEVFFSLVQNWIVTVTNTSLFIDENNLTIQGSSASDLLIGGLNDTVINGGGGNDYILGDRIISQENGGKNTIDGGGGNDVMFGGTGTDFLTGGTGDDVLTGGGGNDNLYGGDGNDVVNAGIGDDLIVGGDGAGNDTYNGGDGIDTVKYTSALGGIKVDLSTTTGTATSVGANDASHIGNDRLTGIENIIAGNYGDQIMGSSDDNYLAGLLGIDIIDGQSGNDILDGGAGNDVLIGGSGNDQLLGGDGTDITQYSGASTNYGVIKLANGTVRVTDNGSGYSDGIDLLTGVETIQFSNTTISTSSLVADTIAPTISSGTPVSGGTNIALDANLSFTFSETVIAGSGNILIKSGNTTVQTISVTDIQVTFSGSTVTINPNSDLAYGTAYSIVIASGVITDSVGNAYTGTSTYNFTTVFNTVSGTDGDDTLEGTSGGDILSGSLGSDILIGGLGNDQLDGGDGSDTASYSTSTLGVTVSLALTTSQNTIGAGRDTLSNIENLTGGSGNDKLTGNGSTNFLDGGLGVDTLTGGAGNDTYIVDLVEATGKVQDTIVEISTGGTLDTVQLRGSSTNAVAVTLTAGAGIEAIDASATGSSKLNLTGNTFGNTLTGNDADNILDGGTGIDALSGGAGNDTYIVDTLTDTITEASNGGTDTVQSSVTFSLASLAEIENLTLTGVSAISGTGNTADNILTGNSSSNTLSGGDGSDTLIGGLGNDRLTGGDGVDHFVFNTTPTSTSNKDTITDFTHGTDVIDLSKAIFKGLGSTIGELSSDAFYSGAGVIKSHDLDDRIIYNTTNGFLYYDADGTGKAAAIQIALLSNMPSDLSYSDFSIIG